MIESVANVTTDRPERYLKQLVSHLGREVDAEQSEDGHSGALIFSSGNCALNAEPGMLRLTARAQDDERLAAVETVVARGIWCGSGRRTRWSWCGRRRWRCSGARRPLSARHYAVAMTPRHIDMCQGRYS